MPASSAHLLSHLPSDVSRFIAPSITTTSQADHRPVEKLGRGQIRDLLNELDEPETRDSNAAAADAGGWTRDVLANQIMNRTP